MYSPSEELGIISAFVTNLEEQTIPRALAVRKRIFEGELLNEIDCMYFEQQLSEASSIMPMLENHPEYQILVGEVASLYNEIAEQALKNQQKL